MNPLSQLEIIDTDNIADSNDKTWIVSGQSTNQKEILEGLSEGTALYVEGAFRLWLRDNQVSYFILRGPPVPPLVPPDTDNDDFSVMSLWVAGEKSKGSRQM